MNWFDREEDLLCEQLNDGLITQEEFRAEMRILRDQLRAEAQEQADAAYDNVMNGGW